MKTPLFNRVAILGLGLIGGSIALEIKKKGLAKEVVGYNRSIASRKIALKRKACDIVTDDPGEAVRNADLVILATPVGYLPKLSHQIKSHLSPKTLVTDVGSTKEKVLIAVKKILPKNIYFIGGHPIAGTEHSGMEAACLDLFKGCWWILTPFDQTPQAYTLKLKKFVRSLGSKVAILSPREHDYILAGISHLPHMVAYALVGTLMGRQRRGSLCYAAGGFKDFTRIAASSPEMWADICEDNADNILKAIRDFEKSLQKIKALVKGRHKRGLIRFFFLVSQSRKQL